MMGTQLRLPAQWAFQHSRRDPRERLEALHEDVAAAKAQIRDVLDALAARHGIAAKDVASAIEGYADDMLSDVIYNVEREIEREMEDREPV